MIIKMVGLRIAHRLQTDGEEAGHSKAEIAGHRLDLRLDDWTTPPPPSKPTPPLPSEPTQPSTI